MMSDKAFTVDKEVEISIPLHNYLGDNGFPSKKTSNAKEKNVSEKMEIPKFIGRKEELSRFKKILKDTRGKGGSYLVSGYRGVGKTHFVKEVLSRYKEESISDKNNFIAVININLGNDSKLSSSTILSDMVSLLRDDIRTHLKTDSKYKCNQIIINFLSGLLALCILLLFLDIFYLPFPFLDAFLPVDILGSVIHNDIFATIVFGISSTCYYFFRYKKKFSVQISLLSSLKSLDQLFKEIHCSSENNVRIGNRWTGFGEKIFHKPLDSNEIESRMQRVIKDSINLDVIFVFDELDKLTGMHAENTNPGVLHEEKLRKKQVDILLGEMKNLITGSVARYIFIAGREMHDAYLSERGNSNSLYESLFTYYFYVPSLLTDNSDKQVYLLDSMVEVFLVSKLITSDELIESEGLENKKESDVNNNMLIHLKLSAYSEILTNRNKKNNDELSKEETKELEKYKLKLIFILKMLIHFLTLHSWGNYKRLLALFESFIKIRKESDGIIKYELYFSTRDIQRLSLASHLYILFHHNLSRMLMNADDKLVVSTFSVFHYIMKFHGMGFSRGHINRMYEMINVHSSPELTRTVDVILNNVLSCHVRRIRNSFYRYRFSSLYEQEIHFITTISDVDSAVFSFSLDAMDNVKRHYLSYLIDDKRIPDEHQCKDITLVSTYVIVGNYYFWEQSYDEANIHYGFSLKVLEKYLDEHQEDVNALVQLVEVSLKLASVAERGGNYLLAASIYTNAERRTMAHWKLDTDTSRNDSKWDVLRQPKWAKKFLNLKRSAVHYQNKLNMSVENADDSNDVDIYRAGVLAYFMDNHNQALSHFIRVAKDTNVINAIDERSVYLGGNACLKAGFSLLSQYGHYLHESIIDIYRIESKDNTHNLSLLKSSGKLVESVIGELKELNNMKSLSDFENFIAPKNSEGDRHLKKISDQYSTANKDNMLSTAVGLMVISAHAFERGRLNSNASLAYMSILTVWEMLLEIIPWARLNGMIESSSLVSSENGKKDIKKLGKRINEAREEITKIRGNSKNWIFEAQESAFIRNRYNTGCAFSHFMKTTLHRNLRTAVKDSLFGKVDNNRDLVMSDEFKNTLLYQHYSMFGQMAVALIHWEDITAKSVCLTSNELKGLCTKNNNENEIKESDILPYSIRYYATILWIRGKQYLKKLSDGNYKKTSREKKVLPSSMKRVAANAIVNLFRASQYVTKTRENTSNIMLPPIYLIYYNLWETVFKLVSEYRTLTKGEVTYESAIAGVRDEMDKVLIHYEVMDVSSRMVDLYYLFHIAIEQFSVVEKMGDPNSRDRTNVLRVKYYLDDDYEDNMFNLDWCFCRSFAPGALLHKVIIEHETKWLKDDNNFIDSADIGQPPTTEI